MKNRDLQEAVSSINVLAALKLPTKTAFLVALNLKAIKDHLTVFHDQRKRLVELHTERDSDGVPVPVLVPELDESKKPRLDAQGKVITRVAEGSVVLKDTGKPFRKDEDDLLDIDIDDMLKIQPVKISTIVGEIEPQHLTNIMWMFIDDLSPA